MTEAVKYMVQRFLSWRLPENFNPDAGISFKPTFNDHLPVPMKHNPTGTNLFDYTQAKAMVEHMLEGLPTAEALRARDERISELERERDNLSELVRGWHYLAVGPDEMGDYHTQRKLIELSEPYASPALKTLKEKNDDA